MTLYWLNTTTIVRRNRYINDVGALYTIFTSVKSSVQQDDVPIGLSNAGYSHRTYTVFMDNTKAIMPEDRIVTTDGKELRVIGVKEINVGFEPYLTINCEEEI